MIKKLILSVLLAVGAFSAVKAFNKDGDVNNNRPPVIVPFAESELPVIMVNTMNQTLYRDTYKLVKLAIIRNKSGINMVDTVTHVGQKFNYNGYAMIKYHGTSSFESTFKPPFTIKLCDADGNSQKASLLGMGKAKKWILNAPYMDRSLVRDKFIFDTFRPYFDFVPDMEPAELVIDGVYRGVYYIEEKIGLNKNRIDADDPGAGTEGEDPDWVTGGYVVKVDRGDEKYTSLSGTVYDNFYKSLYAAHERKTLFSGTKYYYIYYNYVEPDIEDMIDGGVGNRDWINSRIYDFETGIKNGDFGYVDMNSFAAYMLATEFARNVDGYRLSTYLYKYRDSVDKRFKMTLWDFDRSLGNSDGDSGADASTWSYNFNSRHATSDDIFIPFYWKVLLDNEEFQKSAKFLWTLMRRTTMTDDALIGHLHELSDVLVSSNAQERNDQAYNIWSLGKIKPITNEQSRFKNVGQEIAYIESFIQKRLTYMDNAFLLDYLPGDVNDDNRFTIADVAGIIAIMNHQNVTSLNVKAADANQDGKVTMEDVFLVSNRVLGKA